MRRLLILLAAASAAHARDPYPPGVAVKVAEYVLVDGRKIGIAEWTDASTKAAVVRPPESDADRLARLRAVPMFTTAVGPKELRPRTTVGVWMDAGNDPRTLGEREGWLTDDDVVFLLKHGVVPRTAPAPGVAAPQVFRGVQVGPARDPDHQCDRCGASQYVVAGPGPIPGTHTHRCPRCGNVWFH